MSIPTRFVVFCLCAVLSMAGSAATGQQTPVLPKQFASWTQGVLSGVPSRLDPGVQRELGADSPQALSYSSGGKQILVAMQKYKDPSSAYAAYTLQLNPGMRPSDVRKLSAAGQDRVVMLIGNFVLDVEQAKNISTADIGSLATAVENRADSTPLPPIRAYLPEERLIPGTQRYALGPAGFNAALATLNESKFAPIALEIDFRTGAEAMLASYQSERNQTQDLLIIDYPTPQIAEQRLHHIQSVIATSSALAGATVERRGSLLSLVLSPLSAAAAAQLRDGIRYGTSVTWNEPSQTLTDPPWLLVVKGIFVGTLAFCGIAIVMGIAFGGVRVVTKKLFPGKVFDRPEDIEVLQLGLSGKRIDPRDFY
jgi:hypothetical protein